MCKHNGTATGILVSTNRDHSKLIPAVVCEACGETLSIGAPLYHQIDPMLGDPRQLAQAA